MTKMTDESFRGEVVSTLRAIFYTLLLMLSFTQMTCYQSCSTTEYLRHDLNRSLATEPRKAPEPAAKVDTPGAQP